MNDLPIIDAEFEDIITPSTKKQIVVVNKIVKPKRMAKQKQIVLRQDRQNNPSGFDLRSVEREFQKGIENMALSFVRGIFR